MLIDKNVDSNRPRCGRRRWPRRQLVATAVILASGCIGGTAATTRGVGAAAKPTLTIARFSACDASLITPLTGNADTRLDSVYQSLIFLDAKGRLRPSLATSWSVKPGNKVMTLTLRQHVRFSDGEALDAKALKTWFDYRATISNSASSQMGLVQSVAVLSKYTVRITLKAPNPDFARALSSYGGTDWGHVVAPKAIGQLRADPKSSVLTTGSYGAGPYVLLPSATVVGDHCTYVPNKFYYDKSKIKWGKIVWKSISDPNATLAALRTGQVDVAMSADWTTANAVRAAGLKVVTNPSNNYVMYFYDLSGKLYPAEADLRVRQAMNYAIDRKTITKALCAPGSAPTSLAYSVQLTGRTPSKYANYYPYNPAKARALLAAAGYKSGFEIKIVSTSAWAGGGNLQPVAAAIAQNLAAVGITDDVVAPPTADLWLKELFSGQNAGMQLLSGPETVWQYYEIHYLPATRDKGISDQHGWSDPILTKLWNKGARLPAKQAEAVWRQFNERLVTRAYTLPLCRTDDYAYASKKVGGFSASRRSYTYSPIVDWYPANG